MKVFILTIGSRGDVQPYVALGKGLKDAGHGVTVCTSSSFEPLIREHGLDYGFMNDGFMRLMDSDLGREIMENAGGFFGMIEAMVKLIKVAKPLMRQLLQDSWKSAMSARPDIMIFHPNGLGGLHIAEKFGVPAVIAAPWPLVVPTAEFPAIGFPGWRLGRGYNKITHALVLQSFRMYKGMVDKFRRETLGLPGVTPSSLALRKSGGRPIPVLHCYSRHVIPRPADWSDSAYVTGYCFLDRSGQWQPQAELEEFLRAGEPPVSVGFGSMVGRNPQGLARIVVAALKRAHVRGLILAGRGGLDLSDMPESIFKIDYAPHDWLFPRMAAVVHHGGSGTTASGLRAGRPAAICPFVADQPLWGRRVHALGAGSEPIPQKKLTVENLASAIHELMTNRSIRRNAQALGERIRHEDGVAGAVAIIEKIMKERRSKENNIDSRFFT